MPVKRRTSAYPGEPEADDLRAIAKMWLEMGWQAGDAAVVDKLHAEDFVDHGAAGRNPDNQGFKDGILQLYKAFPDFFAHTDDLVVDAMASKVALRWHATGTHSGTFMGFRASGKSIKFNGIEIIRIADGRIQERWGEWDGEVLINQLRAIT